MNSKTEALLKSTKWEFGNEKHIRALEIVEKIRTREALIKRKAKSEREFQRQIDLLNAELSQEEKNLEHLLK